jgi:hypothetical protein
MKYRYKGREDAQQWLNHHLNELNACDRDVDACRKELDIARYRLKAARADQKNAKRRCERACSAIDNYSFP